MSFVGASCDPVFCGSFLLPGLITMRILKQKTEAAANRVTGPR